MDTFFTWWRWFFTAAMFLTLLAPIAPGAEIRLRERAQVESGIVRLKDVAEITGDPAAVEWLNKIELLAAPPVGSRRYLRIRELQDLLAERQVNLLDNRLSGASVVEIANVPPPVPAAASHVTSRPNVIRARQELRTALVSYLRQSAGRGEAFDVVVAVNDDTALALQQADYRFAVRGGQQPFAGRQRFEVVPEGSAEPIAVEADVSNTPVVVVAVRPLARGALIQAEDVELQPLGSLRIPDSAPSRIEDVVGREASQNLAAGQVLSNKTFRTQRLVQKGNPVTVTARSSGLRVRTTARALEDGAQGEVITVESILNRQSFFARVVGIDEVEVYARAVEARGGETTESVAR